MSRRGWSGDPEQITELDEHVRGGFDAEDSHRWLPVAGSGSKAAYAVMERFIASIDRPGLALRLPEAISGSGAFRRFQVELSLHDDEYTRWHRFRDDARLGASDLARGGAHCGNEGLRWPDSAYLARRVVSSFDR